MVGDRFRQIRLSTLLLWVVLLAVTLAAFRLVATRSGLRAFQAQVEQHRAERAMYLAMAHRAQVHGDSSRVASYLRLARSSDQWSRVYEHLASGRPIQTGPPIPEDEPIDPAP